jgi:hypothetical protein
MAELIHSSRVNSTQDITGSKFGRLTVLRFSHVSKKRRTFICRCDCGKELLRTTSQLTSKQRTVPANCGCLSYARITRHNLHDHFLYSTWKTMRTRCNNPRRDSSKYYIGKGVAVCARWDHFDKFLADMLPTWEKGKSIDRIDNAKGYSPENCRWASPTQQANNKSNPAVYLAVGSETKPVRIWAQEFGIPFPTFFWRLSKKWPLHKLFTPVRAISPTGRTRVGSAI